MKTFPSLPESPDIMDVYKHFEQFEGPLFSQIQFVMRGESELSIGERELIAAYTSVLNSSSYCVGMHASIANAYGISEDTLTSLADDQFSEVEGKEAELLKFVKKAVLHSEKIKRSDTDALLNAGWSEQAIFSALSVCALFCQVNVVVNSTGCVIENPLKDIKPNKMESYK